MYKIDRTRLPARYPTHPPEFWEELGRTIATFGFLEETLGKAIFAISLTTEYEEKDIEKALRESRKQLPLNLTDRLPPLAQKYAKAVKQNASAGATQIGQLEAGMKKVANIRNALCHGSWRIPDASGKSNLYYFNKEMLKGSTRRST